VRQANVNSVSDDTHGVIPLWLDIGYRILPSLTLGTYLVYGLAVPKSAAANDPLGGGCPQGVECFATGVRAGIQARYSLSPKGRVDPWLAVGVGYEWINVQLKGDVAGFSIDWSTSHFGPEFVHLQTGVDLRQLDLGTLGPFIALSALRYSGCAADINGQSVKCELLKEAYHGWFVFGVRGALEL
jgi:hypothetical protein